MALAIEATIAKAVLRSCSVISPARSVMVETFSHSSAILAQRARSSATPVEYPSAASLAAFAGEDGIAMHPVLSSRMSNCGFPVAEFSASKRQKPFDCRLRHRHRP